MQQQFQDVPLTYFTSNISVGGPSGGLFSLFGHRAIFNVKSITFYRTDIIKSIYCEKHDGTNITVGVDQQLDPNPVTFTFDNDEQVTRVLLYSDSKRLRFAGIQMDTNKQSGLQAFGYNYTPDQSDQVEIPVGCGLFNGIFGRSGGEIDSFGVAMLLKSTPLMFHSTK